LTLFYNAQAAIHRRTTNDKRRAADARARRHDQRNAPIQGQGGMTSATPRYKRNANDKANRLDYQAIVAHIRAE
jgi:hypothetical protein